MNPNTRAATVGHLFTSFRDSKHSSREFTPLQDYFLSEAKRIASTYKSVVWQDDILQEVSIALYQAAVKFKGAPGEFYFYAITAMKRGAIDFYRSTMSGSIDEYSVFDSEGRDVTCKRSIFVETQVTNGEEGETFSLLDTIADPVDFVASVTASVDVTYLLSTSNLKKHAFTDREIKVIDLHYRQGYNVSEVAAKVKLSVSQTSKIISKTTEKAQHLLG